ncbi:MAG: YabP/YqfC family sporulation protein [Eubacteriales bacterium]|nr:YabP/YqfC family sporulation protein [Eubacteriales bacterium]
MNNTPTGEHSLQLADRSRLSLSGVEDVTGFDETTVLVKTTMGTLVIGGEELHIEKIDPDTGTLRLDGRISELCYHDASPAVSVWKRLFG